MDFLNPPKTHWSNLMIDKTAIRDAATVIAVRDRHSNPQILMGQRGAKAAFMPNKFVFPGGAVDDADAQIELADQISDPCFTRLSLDSSGPAPQTIAVAAIRELWEETGLVLGVPGQWRDPPTDWKSFAQSGHVPSASGMRFVFRAITPPGRPRRFDARFLMVDACALRGDLDDFSQASDELSHLQWVPIDRARSFDLPFITEVVLAEISAYIALDSAPENVPFFKNSDEENLVLQLGNGSPLRASK